MSLMINETTYHRQSAGARVPIAPIAYVEPMYRAWATDLVAGAGFELSDEDAAGDGAAFVFDGPGVGALRFLLGRPWGLNRATAVYTLHASPIWHAVLDATGAHLARYPEGHRGLGVALERAQAFDVRVAGNAPITKRQAAVLGYVMLGWSDARIAEALGLSAKTVAAHVYAAMDANRAGPGRASRTTLVANVLSAYYTGGEA